MSVSPPSLPAVSRGAKGADRRVVGLDSIRFVCALIVVFGHIGFLPERLHGDTLGGFAKILAGLYNCLFNGPAAVIVFFLISGFCIHFPYRDGRPVNFGVFYLRRFVRIGLPVLAAAAVLQFVFHNFGPLQAVGWSVICEGIYYLLYPALLILRRRSNWRAVALLSILATTAVLAVSFHSLGNGAYGYTALGAGKTWVIGLPVWLMGCWLAENYGSVSIPSPAAMWGTRAGVYALSVGCELWRFHAPHVLASNCILLDLFAVPACFWVAKEIAFASAHPAPRLLEWAGAWSYSLYLVHLMTIYVFTAVGLLAIYSGRSTHFLAIFVALALSYGFFLLVERPSHRLSNAIGKFFRKVDTRPAAVLVAAD